MTWWILALAILWLALTCYLLLTWKKPKDDYDSNRYGGPDNQGYYGLDNDQRVRADPKHEEPGQL